jgi:hypothetical protein
MTAVVFHILAWPTLGVAILVFGFAPGAALRLIVLAFKREDPRRQELLAELHAVPRIERPFWVAEQLEIALFEGLRGRLEGHRNPLARKAKKKKKRTKTTQLGITRTRAEEMAVELAEQVLSQYIEDRNSSSLHHPGMPGEKREQRPGIY